MGSYDIIVPERWNFISIKETTLITLITQTENKQCFYSWSIKSDFYFKFVVIYFCGYVYVCMHTCMPVQMLYRWGGNLGFIFNAERCIPFGVCSCWGQVTRLMIFRGLPLSLPPILHYGCWDQNMLWCSTLQGSVDLSSETYPCLTSTSPNKSYHQALLLNNNKNLRFNFYILQHED